MRQTSIFAEFFNSEKAVGFILIAVTVLSLVLSNTHFSGTYTAIWNKDLGGHTLVHWINDGLMTIFFLLIGLELEREIYMGELSDIKNAALPFFGAIGGMLVPAVLYMAINYGTVTASGAGIPMATDIAFAIGILSLLGSRIPVSLRIFLTALAVIDDLGAILIIALFYSGAVSALNLILALVVFGVLIILNRLRVRSLLPYLAGGLLMWYFMLHSGIHATITGVLLAFAIPFGKDEKSSPSHRLEHYINKPVAFLILPVFAMANTCIPLGGNLLGDAFQPGSAGIAVGLLLGKPLGIFLFSYLAALTGIALKPGDISWKMVAGAGILGGIGFTMSVFITLLAFDDADIINYSKFAVLVSSVIAGIAGYLWLRIIPYKNTGQDYSPVEQNNRPGE